MNTVQRYAGRGNNAHSPNESFTAQPLEQPLNPGLPCDQILFPINIVRPESDSFVASELDIILDALHCYKKHLQESTPNDSTNHAIEGVAEIRSHLLSRALDLLSNHATQARNAQ